MPVSYDKDKKCLTVRFAYNATRLLRFKEAVPFRHFDKTSKTWEVPVEFLPQVTEALGEPLQVDDAAKDALRRLENTIAASYAVDTKSMAVTLPGAALRPYQNAAVRYAEAKGGRVLLGDPPGTGKTLAGLGFLARAPEDRLPVLVVCTAGAKLQWGAYLTRFMAWTQDDVGILFGRPPLVENPEALPAKKAWLINWDILASWLPMLTATPFRTVILDEAHYLQERTSQRSRAAAALLLGKHDEPRIPYVLAMTATPQRNHPENLWHPLHLINPKLFPSYWHFVIRYAGAYKDMVAEWGTWKMGEPSNLEELDRRLRANVMVRRTREALFPNLPSVQRISVPLNIDEKKYGKAKQRFKDNLVRLRASGSRDLGAAEEERIAAANAKYEEAIAWLKNLRETGEPIIVFAHHHGILGQLAEDLDWPLLDGRSTPAARQPVIDAFMAGEFQGLVCGTRAMGESVNLTRASICATVELDWSMATHEQAEGRLRPTEHTNPIVSYYLIGLGTVDEELMRLLEAKQSGTEKVLGDTPSPQVLDALIEALGA